MIISASRRTDIPAFFGEWFINRIQAGYCLVPNPFNPKQVANIPLARKNVDVFVFWTKNPKPFFDKLPILDAKGYPYYFLFTLNDYPWPLEPNLPSISKRINTFRALSDLIGPDRVLWRYDPIIISNVTDYEYHKRVFKNLCEKLEGYTRRVIISVIDFYAKTKRNLKPLREKGFSLDFEPKDRPQTLGLLKEIARIAKDHQIEITSCAEERDFTDLGIAKGSCIDGELITGLWGIKKTWRKDKGQRKACACVTSKDIGMPDTCLHGCPYCYATVSHNIAQKRFKEHDPNSTALIGNPEASLLVKDDKQGALF